MWAANPGQAPLASGRGVAHSKGGRPLKRRANTTTDSRAGQQFAPPPSFESIQMALGSARGRGHRGLQVKGISASAAAARRYMANRSQRANLHNAVLDSRDARCFEVPRASSGEDGGDGDGLTMESFGTLLLFETTAVPKRLNSHPTKSQFAQGNRTRVGGPGVLINTSARTKAGLLLEVRFN